MTIDQYRSFLSTGNLVGVQVHVNGYLATIHDQTAGFCFYNGADGHEYTLRNEDACYLVSCELAMMLWPELKLW